MIATSAARRNALARQYAPVLAKMVEIMTAEEARGVRITFGLALELASKIEETPIPREAEEYLLTAAFSAVVNRRIPGCPDA